MVPAQKKAYSQGLHLAEQVIYLCIICAKHPITNFFKDKGTNKMLHFCYKVVKPM